MFLKLRIAYQFAKQRIYEAAWDEYNRAAEQVNLYSEFNGASDEEIQHNIDEFSAAYPNEHIDCLPEKLQLAILFKAIELYYGIEHKMKLRHTQAWEDYEKAEEAAIGYIDFSGASPEECSRRRNEFNALYPNGHLDLLPKPSLSEYIFYKAKKFILGTP